MGIVVRIPQPKFKLLAWALGMWLASCLWLFAMRALYWSHYDLFWYVLCLILLPWHTLAGLGLMARFAPRVHAMWIVPVLVVLFAAGTWLMSAAMFGYPVRELLVGREVVWLTVYTVPFAIVPVTFYLAWPRAEKVVEVPVCSACGYDLRGSAASERCPECGKAIELGVDAPQPQLG